MEMISNRVFYLLRGLCLIMPHHKRSIEIHMGKNIYIGSRYIFNMATVTTELELMMSVMSHDERNAPLTCANVLPRHGS
jgi:hypothetical protein